MVRQCRYNGCPCLLLLNAAVEAEVVAVVDDLV